MRGKNLLSNFVCVIFYFLVHVIAYRSPFFVVSSDKSNYKDAPTEGIRRVLEKVTGKTIPRGELLNTDKIGMYSRVSLQAI